MTVLPPQVEALIREEQARQGGAFLGRSVVLAEYLAKLGARAEILAHMEGGRCRGAVAFYCNDVVCQKAFITVVVVDPRDRGQGIGEALVSYVLQTARRRGFVACRLEVQKANHPALALYEAGGFRIVEDRGDRELLEVML